MPRESAGVLDPPLAEAGRPRPSAAAVRARHAPQTPLARSSASTSFPPQAPHGSDGAAAAVGTGVGEPALGAGRGVAGGMAGGAARGGVFGPGGPAWGSPPDGTGGRGVAFHGSERSVSGQASASGPPRS